MRNSRVILFWLLPSIHSTLLHQYRRTVIIQLTSSINKQWRDWIFDFFFISHEQSRAVMIWCPYFRIDIFKICILYIGINKHSNKFVDVPLKCKSGTQAPFPPSRHGSSYQYRYSIVTVHHDQYFCVIQSITISSVIRIVRGLHLTETPSWSFFDLVKLWLTRPFREKWSLRRRLITLLVQKTVVGKRGNGFRRTHDREKIIE